ncbi:MAG: hypothetical protein EBX35_13615 [Planctomycetia bacterium]|nr:hypothetical protein [Planctomycetia bacterium]
MALPGQWHFLNGLRADERLVNRVFAVFDPDQRHLERLPSPWSGRVLPSARSLSEFGRLGALV